MGVKSGSMPPSRTKPRTGLLTRGSIPTSLVDLVVNDLPSPHSRRAYRKSIDDLYAFATREDGKIRLITPALLMEWRTTLASTLSPATVNLRFNAVRTLVRTAARRELMPADEAMQLLDVGGLPFRGTRVGNWLTVQQTRQLLNLPNRKNLRGARNYCIFALLAGCALRVHELAALELSTIQQRDGRWVLADLPGKGGRVRTVAIPPWVKQGIDNWLRQTKIKLGIKHFGPHDLRRTCARLCREQGGDLEQIQAMLGHASLVTTQRYLGTVQNLKNAVNDNLGL
jgi:integrase